MEEGGRENVPGCVGVLDYADCFSEAAGSVTVSMDGRLV